MGDKTSETQLLGYRAGLISQGEIGHRTSWLGYHAHTKTRSRAQGKCSAKSLAGNVIDSSLSSLSSVGGRGQGGSGRGRGLGEGEGC